MAHFQPHPLTPRARRHFFFRLAARCCARIRVRELGVFGFRGFGVGDVEVVAGEVLAVEGGLWAEGSRQW
jgi:hypothetical protein